MERWIDGDDVNFYNGKKDGVKSETWTSSLFHRLSFTKQSAEN